jgi:hypothetical protein
MNLYSWSKAKGISIMSFSNLLSPVLLTKTGTFFVCPFPRAVHLMNELMVFEESN